MALRARLPSNTDLDSGAARKRLRPPGGSSRKPSPSSFTKRTGKLLSLKAKLKSGGRLWLALARRARYLADETNREVVDSIGPSCAESPGGLKPAPLGRESPEHRLSSG